MGTNKPDNPPSKSGKDQAPKEPSGKDPNAKDSSAKEPGAKDLKSPELYINRELSWLEFNDRVLQEGLHDDLPLLERLKFLAIVSSNLDEFFMVRVAGLIQQRAAGRRRDPSGLTPAQQLEAIGRRAHRMVA